LATPTTVASSSPGSTSPVPKPSALVPVGGGSGALAREISSVPEMGWGVKALAFSPDGKYVAAGKNDDQVWVFEAATGKRVSFTPRLDDIGSVSCVAFTPDGKRMLFGGYKGKINICKFDEKGQFALERSFNGHSEEVHVLEIGADGKFALSGGRDKRVRYWNLETAREELTLDGFDREVKAARFDPDGAHAWATDGRKLLQFNLKTGEKTRENQLGGYSLSTALSPDASLVCSAGGQKLQISQTATGVQKPVLDQGEIAWCAVFSTDKKRLYTGGNGKVYVWDVEAANPLGTIRVSDILYIQAIAVSRDGKYLAAIPSAAGQTLRIFELTAGP
jgi:Tol biopolymer transport system component